MSEKVITSVERVAFWDTTIGQWTISDVRPGTTTKVGNQDAYLDLRLWPEDKPPPDLRVVSVRPS